MLEGRLAAGSHSGARVPVGGTSVAAPQIARWVADDLSVGNAGDRARVQWKATFDEANAPPGDPPPLPSRRRLGRRPRRRPNAAAAAASGASRFRK